MAVAGAVAALVAGSLVLLGGLLGGGRALAHAALIEISPGNDEVVDTAPTEVLLTFNEPVSLTGGSVRVLDDQAGVVSQPAVLEDKIITVPLSTGLADGTYTIAYEVVSADSHRIAGASVFHVGERSAAGAVAIPTPSDDVAWGVRLGAIAFSGIGAAGALVAGGVLAVSLYGDGSRSLLKRPGARDALSRRWDATIVRAAVLGAVATIAATPFRIARVGGGLDALRDNELIREALRGPIGQSMAVIVLALLAVAVAVDQRAPGLVVGGFAVAATVGFTLEGHSRAIRRVAMTTFDVVHLLAGAVWLGGIVALLIAFRSSTEPGRLALVVRRFSAAAVVAVVALAATGAAMAWIVLPGWAEVTGTGWGIALIVKVVVVASVVVIGAYNNRRLVPTFDGARSARATRRLAATVGTETVLLLGVVAITSVLVTRSPVGSSAPPPATAAPVSAPAGETVTVSLSDGGTAELIVSPAQVGANEIEVVLRDAEGRIVNPVAAPVVSFTEPLLDIGPLEPEMTPRYIGDYEATVDLSFAGAWEVDVRVRVTDFESVAGATTLTIVEP